MSSNHTRIMNSEWEAMQRKISSSEAYVINRKAEADRIARLVQDRERKLETIQRANQEVMQQSIRVLNDMFNDRVNVVRENVSAQLREQADNFSSELQSLHGELRNASGRLDVFNDRINTLANTYNVFFNEYANMQHLSDKRARLILSEVDRLIELIEALEPSRFTPNEYSRLVALRESIRVNLNVGDSQAAITVSQNSIVEATALLARLQLITEEYNHRENKIRERINLLHNEIDRLSSPDGVLSIELDGEIEEFDYDISYWSHGVFDSLVVNFNEIRNLIDSNSLNLDHLNQVENNLSVLEENVSICDRNSRRERVAALTAADTVLRLHDGLVSSGWFLESSAYASDDERNPHASTYTDPSGNVVSIVVNPVSPESPEIIMEVFSEDEALADLTKDGLHAIMENDGVTINSREVRDDCHLNPDPETFIENAIEEAQETLGRRL